MYSSPVAIGHFTSYFCDGGWCTHVYVWFMECALFGGKNALQIVFAVRSLEVVASRRLPQVWDFQSMTRALSALGSVSASRSVRSEKFYCTITLLVGTQTSYFTAYRITRTPFIFCNSCNHYSLPCQVPHTLGLTCDLGFNWSSCTCIFCNTLAMKVFPQRHLPGTQVFKRYTTQPSH